MHGKASWHSAVCVGTLYFKKGQEKCVETNHRPFPKKIREVKVHGNREQKSGFGVQATV